VNGTRDHKLIKYMDQESNNGKRNKTLKVLQIHNVIYVVCFFMVICEETCVMPVFIFRAFATTNIALSNYLVFPSDCKRRHRLISFIYLFIDCSMILNGVQKTASH
jgi:hypothetical protein